MDISQKPTNEGRENVIAGQPATCCLVGNLHEGQPKGKTTKVLDVDTYVAEPREDKSNGHIILYFPDVFGYVRRQRAQCT